MTKYIAAFVTLLFITTTHAQTWAERAESFKDTWAQGSDSVRILLGAHAGANHYGLDYEHRMGMAGIGAFLLQGNESTAMTRPEFMTFGLVAPLHLIDRSSFDIYFAPGVNVTQHKDMLVAAEEEDLTTWGATLKFGMLYYMGTNWNMGLDFIKIHNVNDSRLADEDDLVNLAFGFTW